VQADQQRIHHAPGARLVAEQPEFERQVAEMAVHKRVDAAGVSRHRGAIRRRHIDVSALGDAAHPKAAGFAVRFERRGANHLRQVARGQTA